MRLIDLDEFLRQNCVDRMDGKSCEECKHHVLEVSCERLMEQPAIDPVKWIPATERDPEKSGEYLVTFRKTEKAPSRWSDEPFIGINGYIGGWQTGTWFEVTAWAEPPEPWKGEENE